MTRIIALKSMLAKARLQSSRLQMSLGKLSTIASDILGYEVTADICSGDEIEFRKVCKDGTIDDYCCITEQDVLTRAMEE